eukprot:1878803-Prymnesium_polylepis.1
MENRVDKCDARALAGRLDRLLDDACATLGASAAIELQRGPARAERDPDQTRSRARLDKVELPEQRHDDELCSREAHG